MELVEIGSAWRAGAPSTRLAWARHARWEVVIGFDGQGGVATLHPEPAEKPMTDLWIGVRRLLMWPT